MKRIRIILAIAAIGLLNMASPAQIFITNGLVAYYPFNGNANDATGNGNDGTAINGVSYVPSPLGSAASFNGSSQYISLPNTISNYQDLSVTFWVNTSDSNPNGFPYEEFLISRDISGYALDWNICLGKGRKIDFVTDADELMTTQNIASNNWVQVSCVADSVNQVKILFVNGQEVASASWLPNPFANNTVPIFIGASSVDTGSHAFFTGGMTDVRIYNRALTTNEVQAIYDDESGQCTPPPSGLVGWWTGDGTTMDVMNINNGTLVGGTTYAPGEVGQAFQFSAVGDQVSVPTSGFPIGTNDRTIECWVYINSFIPDEGANFAFYGTNNENGGSYILGAYSDQRVFFSQWGSGIFGPALTTNQWYHVAVTSEGTNTTLYLDGTNVGSGYLPFNTPADSQLFIGGIYYQFATYQMIGLIDEVSIYNRALSSNEIAAIYNAGSGGKCNSHPYPPLPRTATATSELAGSIVVGVDIVDGGAGYTNTPAIRFIGGGGTGAQASVVVNNGVVVAIDITNPGSGYTNTPIVVIDPPFILNPVLSIASISTLNFSNLIVGTNYQLQLFQSTTWVNQSASFKATNNFYTTMVSGAVGSGDYRLAQIPVPIQATAFAQVVNGFVVNVLVNNQGSGYVTVPTVAIIANVGSNATAMASISNGRVTSIAVTSAGIHYVNPVTVQIDPPPVTALSPAVMSGVVINSSSLAPYDNYQIQFRPDFGTAWENLSGGLFSPSATANAQYIFLTNNIGFFRLQYVP
jgi:hypothetical protein